MIDPTLHVAQKELADAIRIWNGTAVTLIDIRHNLIAPGEAVRAYHLPASALVYTSGAKAEVLLDDTAYSVQRFGLFHSAKGTRLSILPDDDWLEYYMVLYKTSDPPFHKRELARLMEHTNPFRQQYGFAPSNPLYFMQQLRSMYEHWKNPTPLNVLYGKAVFYQLIYEVYKALEEGSISVFEPDSITMAQRYLDAHFAQPVSMHELCGMLGISYSSFYRNFKQKTGLTPQQYLIDARLNAAKHHLRDAGVSIREVAEHCGFTDEHSFFRMFTKHAGLSPSAYRQISHAHLNDAAIGNRLLFAYNEEDRVSLDKLKGKGAISMFKQMKSKTVVAAALSLMLLLSACNAAPAGTEQPSSSSTAAVTTKTPAPETTDPVQEGTRTVSTSDGDVEVPMNPRRVAVQYLMGDVAALGITPVAISDVYDGAAFSELVADSVSLGWFPEWEEESLMALEPDIILVIAEEYVDKFSKIAPTILVPYGDMTQSERVTFIGELLNRQEEAAKALSQYDESLQNAKTQLQQAGFDNYTVSVFEGGADAKMVVFGSKYGAGSIAYNSLGLHAPTAVQTNIIDKDGYSESVSFEVLADYSGDFIIRNAYEGMADLTKDAIWNAIAAVKNDRMIEMAFGLNYYSDIYSATTQIQYLTQALLDAAK